jgi:hypothetical protein
MNEVFCLAEDNLLHMYCQDTDSVHILHDDVPRLAQEFRVKYGRELIGKNLGQFHCDFVSLDGSESVAKRSVFCGKKIYLDELVDENEKVTYQSRMKGIKNDDIGITANQLYH